MDCGGSEMGIAYIVYCSKCKRDPWVIEDDKYDPVSGFSCEYCSSLGQLDMNKIACSVMTEEQLYGYILMKDGLAKKVDFE